MVTDAKRVAKRIKAHKALTHSKVGAGEPKWDDRFFFDDVDREIALVKALTWYSEYCTPKDERRWFLEYVKQKLTKKELAYAESLPLGTFVWIGKICRMLSLGAPFTNTSNIMPRIAALIGQIRMDTKGTVKTTDSKSGEESESAIQQRIRDKRSAIVSMFLQELGSHFFELNKTGKNADGVFAPPFNIREWISRVGIKPIYCKEIAEFVKRNEIEDYKTLALDKKPDAQLVEGYSHLTKKQIKARYTILQQIIDDISSHLLTAKANGKPRKQRARKLKSPQEIVAKLQWCKQYGEWKSIQPTNLCAAQYALVYNTKTRKLVIFQASGPDGLSVKGTTIIGWDPSESKQYRLRKPEVIVPQFLVPNIGIRDTKRILKSLTTKPTTPRGRVNGDCLILNTI